jgi:hypothetical protein
MATATTVRVPCTTIGNISHCQILPFHDYEASSSPAQYVLDAQRKLIGNIFLPNRARGRRPFEDIGYGEGSIFGLTRGRWKWDLRCC